MIAATVVGHVLVWRAASYNRSRCKCDQKKLVALRNSVEVLQAMIRPSTSRMK